MSEISQLADQHLNDVMSRVHTTPRNVLRSSQNDLDAPYYEPLGRELPEPPPIQEPGGEVYLHPFQISLADDLISVGWGSVTGQTWYESGDGDVRPAAVELVPTIGAGALVRNPLGSPAGTIALGATCGVWMRVKWLSGFYSAVPWFMTGTGDTQSYVSYPSEAVVVTDTTHTDHDDGQALSTAIGPSHTFYYLGKITVVGSVKTISQWRRSDLVLRGMVTTDQFP